MESGRHACASNRLPSLWFVLLFLAYCVPLIAYPDGEARARDDAPTRIITIAPNAAEVICALGACEAIIAVDKFCVYPPELKSRPTIGGLFDPDLERIAALRPDLVVLRGRSEAIESLCRERHIAFYHDETDSFAGVTRCVTDLGRLLGRESKASELVAAFEARLAAIRRRVEGEPKPRVLVTLARQRDRLSNLITAGRGTFVDEMIEIAGGVCALGRLDAAYPQISPEAIVAHRPEVIIELLPEVTLTPELQAGMLEQWRRLGAIPAVTGGRIYFVTDDHSLIPSLRYVDIVEKVSRLLHP